MTKRAAYKRIGFGFIVGVIVYSIGYWTESDATIQAGFFAAHGIHALGVSNLAEAKGYKGGVYFILTLFFTLLIGIVVVWMLPNRATTREEETHVDGQM